MGGQVGHISSKQIFDGGKRRVCGRPNQSEEGIRIRGAEKERRIEKKPVRVAKCYILYFVYFPSVSRDIII